MLGLGEENQDTSSLYKKTEAIICKKRVEADLVSGPAVHFAEATVDLLLQV